MAEWETTKEREEREEEERRRKEEEKRVADIAAKLSILAEKEEAQKRKEEREATTREKKEAKAKEKVEVAEAKAKVKAEAKAKEKAAEREAKFEEPFRKKARERGEILEGLTPKEREKYAKTERKVSLEKIRAEERKAKAEARGGRGKAISAAVGFGAGFLLAKGKRTAERAVGAAPRAVTRAMPSGIQTKGYLPGKEVVERLTPELSGMRQLTTLSGAGLRMMPSIKKPTPEEAVYSEIVQNGGGEGREEIMQKGEASGYARQRLGQALSRLKKLHLIKAAPEYSKAGETYYEVEE